MVLASHAAAFGFRASDCYNAAVSLRRESRRMSRAFGALVLALAPAAAAQACGDSSDSGARALDDATLDEAADGITGDGALPGDEPDAITAADGRCVMGAEMLDGGPDALPDADFGCIYTLPCGLQDGAPFELRGCALYETANDGSTDADLGCFLPEGKGCTADAYAPGPFGAVTILCRDCFGGSVAGLRGSADRGHVLQRRGSARTSRVWHTTKPRASTRSFA